MELRAYFNILRRRWWIPIVLTLLVSVLSAIQLKPWQSAPPTQFSAQLRFLIGVLPLDVADASIYDPRYFAWLTSEYLVDDFTEVVSSQLFSQQVSQRLVEQQIVIPGGAISGSAATGKQHRIISVEFTWHNEEEAVAIAHAATAELEENAEFYFYQLGTNDATITLLDGPMVAPVGPTLQEQFAFLIRLILGIVGGLGIAFLAEYLDTSIYSRAHVEELGLPILGSIPKHR
ncbi:MAG: hypothetical protein AAF702_33850 [Chloroflexota bacterium]